MLSSTNLFHTSETKVNLSVYKRTDLVLRTSKRKKCNISLKRFLAIVSGKNDAPTAPSRGCTKKYFPFCMLPAHKAMIKKARSLKRDTFQFLSRSTFQASKSILFYIRKIMRLSSSNWKAPKGESGICRLRLNSRVE